VKAGRFVTSGPVRFVARIPAGSVDVETGDSAEATVTVEALNEPARKQLDDLPIELSNGELVVGVEERMSFRIFGRTPAFRVVVRVPHDSGLHVSTVSADVQARGRYSGAEVKTVSGEVDVAEVTGDANVKSVSGDVRFGNVAGQVAVNSVSGDVEVGEAARGANVKTVSGDQSVGSVTEGTAELQSVSGDIRVGIRRGSGAWMDCRSTSGSTVSELEDADGPPADGPLVEVRAKAVSGDIRVGRA